MHRQAKMEFARRETEQEADAFLSDPDMQLDGGVEVFTRQQFEDALPVDHLTSKPLWEHLGLIQGEHAYLIPIWKSLELAIMVRSSVHANDQSAGSGEDSIRCWLVDEQTLEPNGSKLSRWITRVPGWQERLSMTLHKLWKLGTRIGRCRKCKTRVRLFKVKKEGPNKGKIFISCRSCDFMQFVKIDEN